MNYLFKITPPVLIQKQNLTTTQRLTAKQTPQEAKITAALTTALKQINTTANANIKKLNTLVSSASISATNAKTSATNAAEDATNAETSAANAAEDAATIAAFVATIDDLVSKMDLANVDIDKLQFVCNNLQTVSGLHSNNLLLLDNSIETLFKFFFHRKSSSGIKIDDSTFKMVDSSTLSPIPSYLPSGAVYVP